MEPCSNLDMDECFTKAESKSPMKSPSSPDILLHSNTTELSTPSKIPMPGNMIEISKFPFNWQLQRISGVYQKKNRYISYFQINSAWSLTCLWSKNSPYKPKCVLIRRKSAIGEFLVSGTLKLMHGETCLHQRKFMQMIEDGFLITQVELEYYRYDPLDLPCSIVGILIVHASSDFYQPMGTKVTLFSDVVLKCRTESFAVHKHILSEKSPVFAAMFEAEMKENRENEVDIIDISPNVLEAMLAYLYTGKIELSFSPASQLLYAADKYQFQDLKRECIDYLKNCVSVDNVLKIMALGNLHDEDLKAFAINFICNSREEFAVLEEKIEWKYMCEVTPALVIDIFSRLVKSKDEELKKFKQSMK